MAELLKIYDRSLNLLGRMISLLEFSARKLQLLEKFWYLKMNKYALKPSEFCEIVGSLLSDIEDEQELQLYAREEREFAKNFLQDTKVELETISRRIGKYVKEKIDNMEEA